MTNSRETRPGCAVGAPIVLVPHDPRWSDEFERESARVRAALGDVRLEIHHIGSTAIPGIAAKPIIDMLAVAPELSAIDRRAAALEALGYESMGEFGIPGRRYFRKTSPEGLRTHHLHTYAVGAPDVERHLAFRDYLRAHRAAALEYDELKRELARQFQADMTSYADGKTGFVRSIERLAIPRGEKGLPTREPSRVRILLLSPRERLLLIKYRNTGRSGADNPCWTTAGGGMEPGETIEEAVRRELAEETGITEIQLGPVVWYGEDGRRSGDWGITFREHFVVARSQTETLRSDRWTDHERRQILEMRWWSLEELRKSDETIYPLHLAALLEPILAGVYPGQLLVLPAI